VDEDMRMHNASVSGMEFSSMSRMDSLAGSLAASDGAHVMQNSNNTNSNNTNSNNTNSNNTNSNNTNSNNSANSLNLQFGSLEMGDWFGGETTLRDDGTNSQKYSI
jgi:hypothetical protein